jgi:hypothetical protein
MIQTLWKKCIAPASIHMGYSYLMTILDFTSIVTTHIDTFIPIQGRLVAKQELLFQSIQPFILQLVYSVDSIEAAGAVTGPAYS